MATLIQQMKSLENIRSNFISNNHVKLKKLKEKKTPKQQNNFNEKPGHQSEEIKNRP